MEKSIKEYIVDYVTQQANGLWVSRQEYVKAFSKDDAVQAVRKMDKGACEFIVRPL